MNQESTCRIERTILRRGKLIIAAGTGCVLILGATAASAATGSHRQARPSSEVTAARASVFWRGTNGALYEAQGPANGNLTGPAKRGMGPLGSAPAAGVDGHGNTYVYWRGTNTHLYEGFWNGSSWVGPFDRGQGPLGSGPAVTITSTGTAYVFWTGTNGHLFEAQGPANGNLTGPTDLGMGPLGSAPAAGVDSSGNIAVYWRGTGGALYEAYWNGTAWAGPVNRGMGPLGTLPTVAVTGSGTAYVFWRGTNYHLFEARGPATGNLTGPADLGMGKLGAAPTAGVDSSGSTYAYWRGRTPGDDIYEAFWNGSRWAGPYNRGQGPIGSLPSVAIYG